MYLTPLTLHDDLYEFMCNLCIAEIQGHIFAIDSTGLWTLFRYSGQPNNQVTKHSKQYGWQHSWLCWWSRITKFIFKMADGRHKAKCWKRYNSPINGPIWMKREWSQPIMSLTCPPWCGCHGNGCLATAHCTFSSYGRLEAERVNQFCWNLVYNSKLGSQCQSRDQILKFLKFKMADSRHVGKYSKCHNSPTSGPTVTQLGWSHPIMFSTCSPWCG